MRLVQTVLASSIFSVTMTMASTVMGAEQLVGGAGNLITTNTARFDVDALLTVPAAAVFGIDANGQSAYVNPTQPSGTGSILFAGNAAATTVVAPGSLGSSTLNLNALQLQAGGANQGGTIIGEVFVKNDILFNEALAKNAIYTFKSNVTAGGIIDFRADLASVDNNSLVFNANDRDITVTALDIRATKTGVGGLLGFITGNNTINLDSTIGAAGNGLNSVQLVGNGVVNVSKNIKATTVGLSETTRLNINADLTMTGALTANDTAIVNLNHNTLTVTGVTKFPANTGIALNAANTKTGLLIANVGGVAVTAATNNTKLIVTPTGYLSNTQQIIQNAGNAVYRVTPINITGHSAVLSFDTKQNGNNLDLLVARRAYDSGIHNLNSQASGLGAALESDGAAGRLASDNSDFENFVGLVDRLKTSEEVALALSTAAPTVNSAMIRASHELGERVFSHVDQRLILVQNGQQNYNTGLSAGDVSSEGWGMWAQLFGSDFTQDKRDNIEGYDGDLWGLTVGLDRQINPAFILGLAATYSKTDIDHNLARNTLDIDSLQGSLYGSYKFKPWYAQGMLGVARHDYDQNRHIMVGPTMLATAHSELKASEWMAGIEVGRENHTDYLKIISSALLRYSHLNFDTYQETGAGGFNLKVKPDSLNAFIAGLGLKVQCDAQYESFHLVPEVHLNIYYDFIADRQVANNTMFGTGTVFSAKSFKPSKDSYQVGMGLNVYTASNTIFSISYDFYFKDDFDSHNGFVKLRYQW